MSRSWFITGGAGFLGSHLVDGLLAAGEKVIVYDNLSSGRTEFLPAANAERLRCWFGDVTDQEKLKYTMLDAMPDVVVHLASNPDLSKAQADPDLDFRQGTTLTRNVLEAARRVDVKEFIYASGSGVYGDRGETLLDESALALPVSPYGASKLAGEGLVAAYTSMFGWKSTILRFANITGARQTHGVVRDFVRKLRADPSRLEILGDGSQCKGYMRVQDAVRGMLCAHGAHESGLEVFNVAPPDQITVTQIAGIVCGALDLRPQPELVFGTECCGWPGDVPVVRLDASKLWKRGWERVGSFQAVVEAAQALAREVK